MFDTTCGRIVMLGLACSSAVAEPDSTRCLAQVASQCERQSTYPAQPLKEPNRSRQVDTDSGVVLNQTITVAGQNFYQYFVNSWRDKDGGERYTLVIHERPSARWGSEIWIEFAQRRIYRISLPPARTAIKSVSEEAADITYREVLQADVQRQLIRDEDLSGDEF